jgi:endonuclease/exonuclease/phosphatase family metal-dependent hydrolase
MMQIRAMSFNIFNAIPDDEIEYFSDLWANRADFNVKTIKRYDPDIIGFQEFEPVHWDTYRESLDGYGHYVGNEGGEGTAIFWRSERFDLLEKGYLTLRRASLPHLAHLDDDILMSTVWTKLRCRESGLEFVHLNTHLNDENEDARQAGNALNLAHLKEINPERAMPVVMTGDFNCNPWSPVYRALLHEGYVDSYRAAGHGDSVESSTFHGFHGSNYFALEWGGSVFWRVDWIMVHAGKAEVQTLSCTIVRDAEPPVFASDHYPVVAEIVTLA